MENNPRGIKDGVTNMKSHIKIILCLCVGIISFVTGVYLLLRKPKIELPDGSLSITKNIFTYAPEVTPDMQLVADALEEQNLVGCLSRYDEYDPDVETPQFIVDNGDTVYYSLTNLEASYIIVIDAEGSVKYIEW